MISDVTVVISPTLTMGKVGFRIPLILVCGLTAEVPYAEYTKAEDIKAKFSGNDDVYKTAQLIFMQNNAPKKVAVYGIKTDTDETTALASVLDKDWRQLIVIGSENKETISAYIENTMNKMYFLSVKQTSEMTSFKGRERTVILYDDLANAPTYPEAAIVGEAAGRTVGSFTYKNMIIKGLDPLDINDNKANEIHANGGITLLKKAGDIVTSEGKTASGEYIDIIDSKDYVINNIQYDTQKLLNTADKVPYTDAGISALESVTFNVLTDAYNNGMIASDTEGTALYSVNFAGRADMKAEDRKNRIYTGGNFSFTLAGAIHNVEINGELQI